MEGGGGSGGRLNPTSPSLALRRDREAPEPEPSRGAHPHVVAGYRYTRNTRNTRYAATRSQIYIAHPLPLPWQVSKKMVAHYRYTAHPSPSHGR